MKPSKIVAIVAFVLLYASCSRFSKNFDSDFSLFKSFITRFSGGMISTSADIEVELAFSKTDWLPNQELDNDLFDISPSVKGKVIALSSNRVIFKPAEKLEQDKEYRVTFHLGDCIKAAKELKEFKFTIKTIKQDFVVETADLQSYSRDYQYINCTLRTSDNLAFETAKQLVTTTQNGKNLKLKFNEKTSSPTEFHFIIDSVQRLVDDNEISINWDGSDFDIDQKGSTKFLVPGKNNFSVIKLDVVNEGKTALYINFSDPIKKEQVLDGLVSIETATNLTFAVDGNLLKVFYDGELKGDLLVEIFQGIESVDGYKLKKNYTEKITFEQFKPAVEFVKSGTILPSSNNLSINFKATSLNAVDVRVFRIFENNVLQFLQDNSLDGDNNLRKVALPIAKQKIILKKDNLGNFNKWNVYSLNLANLIKPEQGAIYRVELSFRKSYSLYKCDGTNTEKEKIEDEEVDEEEEWTNNEYYDYYDEGYDWEQRDNPCHVSYYYDKNVSTNILATDLGVIAKRGVGNSFVVIVNNIVSTEPVSGASIEVFNYQKQKLGSFTTNGDGIAEFTTAKKAFFAVVKKDNNTTYVKLDDGYSQAVSNFNVDGEIIQKGLKGYIYGERGVWRPGDTLFLAFILNDLAAKLPANHPIKLRLSDPNGKSVYQAVQSYNTLNHYKFIVPTNANAPTGNWEAMIAVGGAKFYKSIKIETIKPNRLKIKNSLADKLISANTKNTGTIAVTWMHGAVAKDLQVDMQAKFSKSTTAFSKFPNYTFDNPTVKFSSEEVNLYSGKINEQGTATFTIQPNVQSQAPGMLKAAIITKVHENGGDFSTDVITANYSPYNTYVGLKDPAVNKYGMLETGVENKFEVVTLNENGTPKAAQNLEVKVYKVDWSWWWNRSSDDLANFTSSSSKVAYVTKTVNTAANGKGTFQFRVSEGDWGSYLITIYDPIGGHTTGKTVYIDYPYWSGKTRNNNAENASMLVFSTDKQKYSVGETAKISFPSSDGCRALLSLENGSKVIETKWITTQKGETQFELPITSKMAPNAYIHITLLQPHSFSKNDLPLRLYGITPIEVVDKQTVLEPVINMPAVLRPEQNSNITISEKSGKAMSYTIAVVDEGLLDLTRFKTPNAWNSFFAKEALGVKTWDVYDDIIGAFSGKINQIFSIGGDEDLGGGKAKKANRFKPVVMYLGPFKLEKGATATHQIKLPNYIGSVKTMVVAANADEGAYGSAEKVVPVRSPLMILASLPRKVSPSEKITLPVTIFAMEKQVKNVTLQLKTNNLIGAVSGSSQIISFAQPDEKMAYFELAAGSLTGIGKVSVVATSGAEKASFDIEVDVINPNPISHQVKEVVLAANSAEAIDWQLFGVSGTNKAKLEISALPPIDLSKRLDYLIHYPHGCVEQTTSGAFPQLFLADIMDLDETRKKDIQRNVSAAIQKLMSFQISNGGFAYWPGESGADDWASSYVGHFLLEAEKKGYAVPFNMKNNWIQYQKKTAKEWRANSYGNDLAQAYRLYTLALSGNPDIAAMNRLRETKDISNESKIRLAMTYGLIGQKNIGYTLLNASSIDDENQKYYYYYGSSARNRAMTLEALVLLGQNREAYTTATKLANELSSNSWMSTQSSAYSLIAMSKFAKFVGGKEINLTFTQGGKTEVVKSARAIVERPLSTTAPATIQLKNNANATAFVRIITSGVLPVGEELAEERGLKVNINFTDRKGNALNVASLKQGTEIVGTVLITNTTGENVENIALTQIVPSGWEIVNTRYTELDNTADNKVDYTDIRDDRTNFYFSLGAKETRVLKVAMNASYLGKYYLPGIQCEAMYDNNYFARKKGQWITVVKE